MTPEQNALLARLDGWMNTVDDIWEHPNIDDSERTKHFLPDYDDLNNLMPLAFDKCRLSLFPYIYNSATLEVTEWCVVSNYFNVTPKMYYDNDPKIATQQALLAIAREKFSGTDTSV